MEKIRYVAIIDPVKGNAKRYGAAAAILLAKLRDKLLEYDNARNAEIGSPPFPVPANNCPSTWEHPEEYLGVVWDNRRSRLTLMLVDDKPVGVVMNTRWNGGYVSFWNFYVAEEYQGKGYGRKLMDYSMDQHRRLGFTEMGLTVHEGNRAEALYREMGFAVSTKNMYAAL